MAVALGNRGVPEKIMRLIRSFHEDMRAKVRLSLEGVTLEELQVHNGLQQGCCMAPVLFNLYTCAMPGYREVA